MILFTKSIARHLRNQEKRRLVGVYKGIESFQDSLGGAKWILSISTTNAWDVSETQTQIVRDECLSGLDHKNKETNNMRIRS